MKINLVKENDSIENFAGLSQPIPPMVRATPMEPAARRWELSPIMFEGQNLGWTVVKIS